MQLLLLIACIFPVISFGKPSIRQMFIQFREKSKLIDVCTFHFLQKIEGKCIQFSCRLNVKSLQGRSGFLSACLVKIKTEKGKLCKIMQKLKGKMCKNNANCRAGQFLSVSGRDFKYGGEKVFLPFHEHAITLSTFSHFEHIFSL